VNDASLATRGVCFKAAHSGYATVVRSTNSGGDYPSAPNHHLAPASLYRVFYPARKVAGRPDLRWHDLRHTGAVLAASTGASLAELMARLGHSTPQAALKYQHASRGRDAEIAALLSKLAEAKS
jgi:integrase